MTSNRNLFLIKVTLDHVKPPVWRRILIDGKKTVTDLNIEIQRSFGWSFDHLSAFLVGRAEISVSENDPYHHVPNVRLDRFLYEGGKFRYIYDFGDYHAHTLKVEKVVHDVSELKSSLEWEAGPDMELYEDNYNFFTGKFYEEEEEDEELEEYKDAVRLYYSR